MEVTKQKLPCGYTVVPIIVNGTTCMNIIDKKFTINLIIINTIIKIC